MRGTEIMVLGFILVLLGIFLMVAGTLIQGATSTKDAEVRGGGLIMLGPIPIIFGTDAGSVKTVVILAFILMAAAYFLFYRRGL